MKDPVVFFGSGPVAARSLELLAKDTTIEAVVTKPKPAHHRGNFPVLETAEKLHLPVHTVATRSELSELIAGKPFTSKLGVLIDFGIIVGQDTIDYFPLGIVNSHFSILPQWRGADPITFAILSGQEMTGVSLMLLTAGMDEGPLLAYGEFPLEKTVTTPELTESLIKLSHSLLSDVLPKYVVGEAKPLSQEKAAKLRGQAFEPTYSRKLTKEDGIIDWNKPATVIEREVRAFIEWPKSSTRIADKEVIITKARTSSTKGVPGTIQVNGKQLSVLCGEGSLTIEELKPAGKKEMTAAAFLAGYGHLLK